MFLSTLDDDLDDKDSVLQSRRGQIGRAKGPQGKRKADFDLSQNTNTKKARNRLASFTPLERELEMRKIADRQAIDRGIRVLKRTIEYESATDEEKGRLVQKTKEDIVVKRLVLFIYSTYVRFGLFVSTYASKIFFFYKEVSHA